MRIPWRSFKCVCVCVCVHMLQDIEDMVSLPVPDWMSVMTYVSFIYGRFGQNGKNQPFLLWVPLVSSVLYCMCIRCIYTYNVETVGGVCSFQILFLWSCILWPIVSMVTGVTTQLLCTNNNFALLLNHKKDKQPSPSLTPYLSVSW